MTLEISSELRLIAACCIWPASRRRDDAIARAAAQHLEWGEVLRLVARHRVAGLVHDALSRSAVSVPAHAAAQIASAAADTARKGLAMAAEALRVHAAFEADGVPSLNLKGSTLAVLAYGSIAIKQAWDIDTLVPVGKVEQAARALRELGYARVSPLPSLSDKRFAEWTQFAHEAIFRHAEKGVVVELHWQLTDNAPMEAGPFRGGDGQWVQVSGRRLQTLNDEELFSYLCLHGAHHAWGRLKWLADFAAWLGQKPPGEIEALFRSAQRAGAGRAVEQALLLCQLLLGLELPDAVSGAIGKDWVSRQLVAIALQTLAGPESDLEGSLRITGSQFLLARNLGDVWGQLERRLIGWTDFERVALPRQLFFLYPLIRAPSWVWRRVWHASARSG